MGVLLALVAPGAAMDRIIADGSTGVIPLAAALGKAYQTREPAVIIEIGKGLGTKARLQALAEGRIDIALASHGLDAQTVTRQGMMVHEIARIAVVFGVNAGVTVGALTGAQICDIYAGRLKSWRELGGGDLAIVPHTRPETEVDAELVRERFACLRERPLTSSVQVMAKSGDMARALAATAGAVGITTMTVVEQSQGRIRAVMLDGVGTTADNVRAKRYTLTRDSFFVTMAPPPAAVAGFLRFVRSPEGQAVISANGAVPVSVP